MVAKNATKLIDLKEVMRHPLPRHLVHIFEMPLEAALSIQPLNQAYQECSGVEDPWRFLELGLERLGVGCDVAPGGIENIPRRGPVLIAANHPFGGIDGVVLGCIVARVRSDVKFLGNYLLRRMPELRDRVIPVDPFGTAGAAHANAQGLRHAVRWLRDGGALIVFPAGEVSHLDLFRREVADPPWSPHVAGLLRLSGAAALPVYFSGQNSALFHVAGLLHPRLRTALLAREVANKRQSVIQVRIGRPLSRARLAGFATDQALATYLRAACYVLKGCPHRPAPAPPCVSPLSVAEGPASSEVAADVAALEESNRLVESGDMAVYVAQADRIPRVLAEIGRLRELTFRKAGEGTGRAADLDRFDTHYHHLFLWDKAAQRVVGAYRLGVVRQILPVHGPGGLYTSTLFRYKPELLRRLETAVELGRSFIREEYQRSPTGLALLWRGIAEFLAGSPGLSVLFGAVSISGSYHPVSQTLMVRFLCHRRLSPLARLVEPRLPFRPARVEGMDVEALCESLRDIEDVSALVAQIEADGKGVPILLRHYLRLNGMLLGFHVDRNFASVVDGLVLVDVNEGNPKYMAHFRASKRTSAPSGTASATGASTRP